MLWQKENPKQLDSLYVDLCDWFESSCSDDDDDSIEEVDVPMPAKNDELAQHYRKKASEQFEQKNWFDAIELYNQALCFAECDSNEWAHILTERSTCWFSLKMFDECLIDVKLAKKKPGAEMFMPKLNRMLAMCGQKKNQRGNNEQLVHQFKPTLSFDANKKIPFASNAIQIAQKNVKKPTPAAKIERFFQATRAIDVGKTVLIEDAFVAMTSEQYKRCCICMQSATNLVPCIQCTNSLFCHGTCERKSSSDLHRIMCNTILTKCNNKITSETDENHTDLVIRSILMAFEMFNTAQSLLCFVEKVLFDKQYDALATDFGITAKSKYSMFLKSGQKMMHAFDETGM